MKDDFFCVQEATIYTDKINEIVEEIIRNYYLLTKDALLQLKLSLSNNLIKPLLLYNLFYAIEIFLKYSLIKGSLLSIDDIEKIKHNIPELFVKISEIEQYRDYIELKYILDKFKNRNGKELDLSKYFNFKYNRIVGDKTQIFTYDLSQNEEKTIKEVIRWMDLHI